MKVKCPVYGCPYVILVEEGFFHYSKQEAIEKMLEHLKKRHTIGDFWELIEKCVVEHFNKDINEDEDGYIPDKEAEEKIIEKRDKWKPDYSQIMTIKESLEGEKKKKMTEILEQLQKKSRTAEEIWAMLDKLKRTDKLLKHKILYEEYETPKESWVKLIDVKNILKKLKGEK